MSEKLRFGEILVRAGVLERGALETVAREWEAAGGDLGELLVRRGVIDEAAMLQAIGKALNLPTVNLEGVRPDPKALERVPRALCEEYLLVPLEVERSKTGEHLHVAMANPADIRAIKHVTRESRLRIRPLVASAREIRAAIRRSYAGDGGRAEELSVMATATMDAVRPLVAPPPAPVSASAAPLPATVALEVGAPETLFDFGVMDLSAESEPPPLPRAPALEPAKVLEIAEVLDLEADDPITTSDLGTGSGFGYVNVSRRKREAEEPPAAPSRTPVFEPPPLPGAARAPSAPLADARRPAASLPPLPSRAGAASPLRPEAALREPTIARPLPPLPLEAPRPEPTAARPLPPIPTELPRSEPTAARPLAPVPTELPRSEPTAARPLAPVPTELPRSEPTAARPLPPLPPNLRTSRPRLDDLPPRPGSEPPPSRVPSEPPAADPFAARPAPEPEGLVDPREPLDVRRILDRYREEMAEGDEPEDEVIATWLDRFGKERPKQSADEVFDALDTALSRVRPGAGQLVLALVRHLARRGLVDPRELLAELQGE